MAASTRISFYDKLEFEARNHYLVRSRSVQNVQRLPTRGVIFQPKYHQKSFISPSFVFHSEKARAGCTKEVSKSRKRRSEVFNTPVQAYDKKWEVEEPKHKFSVYFPVLGTRDGLTENARYRLLISETPYTNPKPHDFRPVSLSMAKNIGVPRS